MGGPTGGLGYDIKARPDNPDILFVTDANAGVHRSVDGGLTWAAVNAGMTAREGPSRDGIPAFCLTIDPNAPDIVWVGMQNSQGIYRSADGGNTWEKRTTGITETQGLTIRGLTVQPGNSSVVYAAGEISSIAWAGQELWGREFDRVQGVVYRSTDSGLTWSAIWRGDNLARYVLVHPSRPEVIYVSTGLFDREAANSQPDIGAAGGVGVVKSTDGGATWTPMTAGMSNLYVGTLVMHPQNPDVLLAGTGNNAYREGGGLYRSDDGGESWQHLAGQQITSVEFAAADPGTAYAAGNGEFFVSTDGGITWQALLNRHGSSWGPDRLITGFPIDLHSDPRDTGRLFVNNYGGGNLLTGDGGRSWGLASTGYTGAMVSDVAVSRQNPAVVYVNSRSGPFKSTDGGATWTPMNPIEIEPISEGARIAVDPENDAHVLMSSGHQGLTYESTDGGVRWRQVTNFDDELRAMPGHIPAQQGMQAIAFAPSWRLKVYGGFGFQPCVAWLEGCDTPALVGILTSDDGGRTWVRRLGTGFDDKTVASIAVHPTNQDVAWAATLGGGVFKTADGGVTWTPASTGLSDLRVAAIAVAGLTPDVLYAGTATAGVFRSRDGGATWAAVSTGLEPREEIRALAIDPVSPHIVYAGSFRSGVYVSTTGGDTWSLLNTGLRTRSIRALALAADGSIVYAATYGEG
ncbi:MAG: WD40/YVTN/BNR-like repeat-containing protein, partial [Vicinamibacterales bacterium]